MQTTSASRAALLASMTALGLSMLSGVLSVVFCDAPCLAGPTFKIGTTESSNYIDAEIVDSPSPEIPTELNDQGFKSFCVARFTIQPTGKSSVALISSSGSHDADEIALQTLRRWKFKPATIDGKPIQSTRKIRIEFEVE